MKILVIQTTQRYLERPQDTKELMGLAMIDNKFNEAELTFVRLPKDLYETWFNIYDGAIGFKWTKAACEGGLQSLMDSVDAIIIPPINKVREEDKTLLTALVLTKTPIYDYSSRSIGFVRRMILD